ncbi:MAG: metallophosphoesterase family protein, partial [Tissierellia bacterium]|nr:metallophosphoesterase family protein [Tissierellia bacterium]
MKRIFSLWLAMLLLISGILLPQNASATQENVALEQMAFANIEIKAWLADTANENAVNSKEWLYSEANEDPGKTTDWSMGESRNDIWSVGQAPFGAKRGAALYAGSFTTATVLKQYYQDNVDIPAYFFLTSFKAEPAKRQELNFTISYDDAAIVYINGTKVWEGNVPSGGYSNNLSYGAEFAGGDPNKTDVKISADVLQKVLKERNILAVELHQDRSTSSDIYFDLNSFELSDSSAEPSESDDSNQLEYARMPMLTIGEKPTERRFTWYREQAQGYLEIAESNKEGDFSNGTVIEADTKINTNTNQYSSSQVQLKDLKPNTEYMLRVWNGSGNKSQIYRFKTQGVNEYSFLLVGDPQIGASRNVPKDGEGWENTLYKMKEVNPDSAFLLSAGDQVNIPNNENEYLHFIENGGFEGFSLVPVIGNHDSKSVAFSEHFNLPNVTGYGKTEAGGNYYYTYNNTLFIVLNSNNRSMAEHISTIKDAIQYVEREKMNIKWKVVTFHHSIYSVASHANDTSILQRRDEYAPVFKEFGIDVVLMGHDHVYTRSHIMDGLTPIVKYEEDGSVPGEYINPEGTLYLTVNSASGSKYYGILNQQFQYAAVKNQERTPNFTNVVVTDTSFEATTYRTHDKSVVDTVKLIKEAEKPTVVSVEQPLPIEVEYKTAVESIVLPEKVVAKLSDESSRELDVIWSMEEYNGELPGEQEFIGSYNLPEDVVGDKPEVKIKIKVR